MGGGRLKRRVKKAVLFTVLLSAIIFINAGCASKEDVRQDAAKEGIELQPREGGTLRVAFGTAQSENDMFPPTTPNQNLLWSARPCLEPLFEIEESGEVVPFLIEKYQVNEDSTEYIFFIRKNISFSDGTPFDAEAVKWNLEQTRKEGINDFCNQVKGMEVIDAHTLKITLEASNIFFIEVLATNRASLMVSPTAVEKNGVEWAKTNPVGTGPFLLKKWNYNVEMVFEKNDSYWQDGKPYLDGITYHFINNNAVLRASYGNNEYDMILNPSSTLLASLNADGQRTVIYNYPYNAFNLWFSSALDGSPFQNGLVRKAVCHAIDMPTIVKGLYGGEYVAVNQLSNPGTDNWNPEIVGYSYDVEKAKSLLKEAGYSNGFSSSIIAQSTEQNKLLCEAIQSYLKKIGIQLEINMVDEAYFLENVMLNSWGDGMALIPYSFTPDEVSSLVRMLNPDTCLFLHTVDFSERYSAEFDNIISSGTIEEARKHFKEADAILIDGEAKVYPVYICLYAIAQKESVHGVGSGTEGEVRKRYWTPETIWIGGVHIV